MTQEEKDLLLKDLCARLPYGVLCKLKNKTLPLKDVFIDGVVGNKGQLGFGTDTCGRIFQEIDEIKPYLRSMLSMTEEEAEEYNDLVNELSDYDCKQEQSASKTIDWLNKKKFDYRGLIPMGLALEAPEGMYNTKQ